MSLRSPISAVTFPVEFDAILARIDQIDPIQYGKTRNFVDGAVTFLSPYISRGVITLRQIRDNVLARGFHPHEIERFLQELAWREYFQRVWQTKLDAITTDLKQSQGDVTHHQMPDAMVQGTTGIDSIDRSIHELYHTGYLHNHVRMYLASIACNIGKAHWLVPSRWMYAHLLDGDVASNTCSWQWVAGTFSNKRYYCNQEKINKFTYSNQRYTYLDVEAEALATLPVPKELQHKRMWEMKTPLPTLPPPVIDVTKPTAIYNSYNLDPLWRRDESINRVLLLEPSHFRQFPVSEKVITFIVGLSKNIPGIQIMVGEFSDLQRLYQTQGKVADFVSKEHPAFSHYSGVKDAREWLYPHVSGFYPSFFSYWKKCNR